MTEIICSLKTTGQAVVLGWSIGMAYEVLWLPLQSTHRLGSLPDMAFLASEWY